MKITRVDIYKLNVPYHAPLKVAIGEITGAENVAVRITTDSGLSGWGEASPCAYIVGDTQPGCYETVQYLARLVLGKDALAIEARMREINAFIVRESSARSAFDMALHDIAAKAADQPLYRFLGGETGTPLRTDLTIGLQPTVEDSVARARAILDQGFDAIKMKTGRPGLEDVEHVAAVRDLAGREVAIRVDSNQGWDLPTAVANIQEMSAYEVQYAEQPLKHWDHAGLATLRSKVDIPVCADESVFDHHDALKLVRAGAADYLNIKLGKSGGIHTGLKINAIAEAAGCRCMLGCFGESRLALSAAAHFAAARPNIVFLDLDSAFDFQSDPVQGGIIYDAEQGGVIHLPDTPGHGASFDEGQLDPASHVIVQ